MRNLILPIFFTLILAFTAITQDKTTGGAKGKVRNPKGDAIEGVLVQVQQNEKDVATAKTDRKGEFIMVGLKPGTYDFVFTKSGWSEGTLRGVKIEAQTMINLGNRLILKVDEGTIAVIRGSVFDPDGRSVRGAKVEIFRVSGNGETKKLDEDYTSQSGEFVFRMPPNAAKYRFTVTIKGAEPASKDLNVDGAEIYRVAISLKPSQK
jgi:uncharacterized GH25 family protein